MGNIDISYYVLSQSSVCLSPISYHGESSGVGKCRSNSLERSGHEQHRVRIAAGEDESGEEHDDQTEHHGQVVTHPVDNVSAQGVDEYLVNDVS